MKRQFEVGDMFDMLVGSNTTVQLVMCVVAKTKYGIFLVLSSRVQPNLNESTLIDLTFISKDSGPASIPELQYLLINQWQSGTAIC